MKKNNGLVLLVLILVGAIFGSLIGDWFSNVFPILNYGKSIGVDPFTIDLDIIKLTFGLKLSLNFAGIIGMILAFFLYRRL